MRKSSIAATLVMTISATFLVACKTTAPTSKDSSVFTETENWIWWNSRKYIYVVAMNDTRYCWYQSKLYDSELPAAAKTTPKTVGQVQDFIRSVEIPIFRKSSNLNKKTMTLAEINAGISEVTKEAAATDHLAAGLGWMSAASFAVSAAGVPIAATGEGLPVGVPVVLLGWGTGVMFAEVRFMVKATGTDAPSPTDQKNLLKYASVNFGTTSQKITEKNFDFLTAAISAGEKISTDEAATNHLTGHTCPSASDILANVAN